MLIPNSSPASPQRAACAAADGSRAPPPQTTRVPWRSIALSSTVQLHDQAAIPVVGDQEVGARADHCDRHALRRRPAQQLRKHPLVVRAGEQVCRAAGPHGRQPGQRVVALDSVRERHPGAPARHRPPPGASASSKMSPAPIVTSRSPSPSRGRQRALGAVGVDQPPHRAAPCVVGSRPGDREAADPGERPDRLLASRVDVEDRRPRRRPPGPRRSRRRAPWCASTGGAGRRRSGAAGRAREAPRGPPRPRSGGARSRRRSAAPFRCP